MRQLERLAYHAVRNIRATFPPRTVLAIVLGTAITTFGVYSVHRRADITKGSILGPILLFNFWLGVSSSVPSPLLGTLGYALEFKYLGKEFPKTSIFAAICMAGFFRLRELFPPVPPSLTEYPLTVALVGGCFIGAGCGLAIRQGASCAGSGALAPVISKITGCRISRTYLPTDVTVLVLSLSYIPVKCIVYSLITVTVSSFLADFIQNFGARRDDGKDKKEYGIVV